MIGAIVAAGNTDMSWPGSSDGYMQSELDIMEMDDEAAAVAWCEEHYGADGSGFFGGEIDLGPVDNTWLSDEANLVSLMATMGEAFAQGVVGYAHDITVPGTSVDVRPCRDRLLDARRPRRRRPPRSRTHRCAPRRVPNAELRVLDGVGHLSLGDRLPALAAEITQP